MTTPEYRSWQQLALSRTFVLEEDASLREDVFASDGHGDIQTLALGLDDDGFFPLPAE